MHLQTQVRAWVIAEYTVYPFVRVKLTEWLLSGLSTEHCPNALPTYLRNEDSCWSTIHRKLSVSDSYRRKQLIPTLYTASGVTSEIV